MMYASSTPKRSTASCVVVAVEPNCVTLTFQILDATGRLQVLPAKYLPRSPWNCPPLTKNPIDPATLKIGMTVQAAISKVNREFKANDIVPTTAKVVPINLPKSVPRAAQRQPQGPPPFQPEKKNFESRDPYGKERSSGVITGSGLIGPEGDTTMKEEQAAAPVDSGPGKEDEMVPYELSSSGAVSDAGGGGPVVVDLGNYFPAEPEAESTSVEFVGQGEALHAPVYFEAIEETSAGASSSGLTLNVDAVAFTPTASDVTYHDRVETCMAEVLSCTGPVHGWENQGTVEQLESLGGLDGRQPDVSNAPPGNLEAISEEEHGGAEESNPRPVADSAFVTLPVTRDDQPARGITNEDVLKIVETKLFEFASEYVNVTERVARLMVDDFLRAEGRPAVKFV